jgi:hypothetical protein
MGLLLILIILFLYIPIKGHPVVSELGGGLLIEDIMAF